MDLPQALDISHAQLPSVGALETVLPSAPRLRFAAPTAPPDRVKMSSAGTQLNAPVKRVRFNLPTKSPPRSPMRPPSILRPPPTPPPLHDAERAATSLSPSLPRRRASLPAAVSRPRDSLRALETLHSMRAYLRQTCNLENTAHVRRILRPLSLNTLRALLVDAPSQLTRQFGQFESLVAGSLRHPHEALTPQTNRSDWQRIVSRAYRLRERREAEYHLQHFVARSLSMSSHQLRTIDPQQRYAHEVEAFRRRMRAFRRSRGENHAQTSEGGARNSAPSSPARSMTSQREAFTDPLAVRTPLMSVDMGELRLPSTIAGVARRDVAQAQRAVPQTQPQQPMYEVASKLHSQYSTYGAAAATAAAHASYGAYGMYAPQQQPSVMVYMAAAPTAAAQAYHAMPYGYNMGMLAPSVHEMGAAAAAGGGGAGAGAGAVANGAYTMGGHVARYHGVPPPPPPQARQAAAQQQAAAAQAARAAQHGARR